MEAAMWPAGVLVMPDRGWFMSGLGGAIRSRRKALGLTQVELAARTGADQSTISAIESGRRQWPTREVREGIARALGWTNLQLLIAAGEVDPHEAGVVNPADGDARLAKVQALWTELSESQRDSLVVFAEGSASANRTRARID